MIHGVYFRQTCKVTTPFHSPLLSSAVPQILEAAKKSSPLASALEAKVGFYEMMTGMSVELAAGDVAKCVVR